MIPTPLLDELMDRTRRRLRGRPGAGAAAPYSPIQMPGLSVWYDAGDAGTITDAGGGAVSQWDDKSGNTEHLLQGTNNFRPLTGVATQNGINGLRFDGTDDRMLALTLANPAILEWFFCFKINAPQAGNDGLLSNNSDRANIRFDPSGSGQCRYNNDTVIPGAPGDNNDRGAGDGQWNPDNITGSVLADLTLSIGTAHRVHCTKGNNSTQTYASLSMGGDPIGGGRWLGMDLFEIFGSTSVLTAQQRTDARDYLASRWAVT